MTSAQLEDKSYPWHASVRGRLLTAWREDRLPHAILLAGPAGMGKLVLARGFAATLLCNQPATDGVPCGTCKGCHLLHAGSHPDLREAGLEDGSRQIKIDQIRGLIGFCALTAQYDGWQVALVHPAEAMNINAANSLLKLLEEPPPDTLLILVSHAPAQLSATIRSRCQRFDLKPVYDSTAQDWLRAELGRSEADPALLLALTQGAPLAALETAAQLSKRQELLDNLHHLLQAKSDPVQVAERWAALGPALSLHWLWLWTLDLVRCAVGGETLYNPDQRRKLQEQARQWPLPGLFEVLEEQQQALRLLNSTANLKAQGLLEGVALAWLKLATQARKQT